MPPPTPTPKLLPPATRPPDEDDWDAKEYRYLMEDEGVTPLSLSMSPFIFRRSPPLPFVPYPPHSCHHCRPLARLCLSVICRHFHTCQNPRIFSIAPLPVLLSGPPSAIIYLSPNHLFLPSIHTTSAIFYPYTPTHPLPLYPTPIYFYLSILSHSLSLSSLYHSLCVSLYSYSTSYSPDLTLY